MSSEPPSSAAPPASPCRRQCCLDARDICLGCGRSLQDILDWNAADAGRRRQICREAEQRLQRGKTAP